ncbi:hypothetical protein HYS48_01570 [Candidatus Woesearchaeota archaeon]|nr:hypothetical protein [Candidatus Woesearchaeota archaeon]
MAKRKKFHALVTRANLATLVGWKPTQITVAEKREMTRRFHSQEQGGTYSEFIGKYPSQPPGGDGKVQHALVKSCAAIMAMHRADSLELIRKRHGLDEYRQQLIEAIAEHLSFEQGLEKILQYLNTIGRDKVRAPGIGTARTLEDVANIMPEISAAEIAWVSAIKGVPHAYLEQGKGVPTILDFNIDGIEFGFDGLNSLDLQRETSFDPYAAAGFTGANAGVTFHAFAPEFAKAFKALALLILSDAFIYTRLHTDYQSNALIKGDGKLKRKLIEQDAQSYGLSPEQLETGRLENLPITPKQFAALEEKIRTLLSSKYLYDLGRECLCSPKDIVTITGLLERVPETFLDEKLFRGYLLPFGKGIKILDQEGRELAYVPYDPFLQIVAQESLYYEPQNISRKNQLLSMVFDSYASELEARFVDIRLPLDRLREQFRIKYGILIPSRAVKSLREEKQPLFHAFAATTGTDTTIFEYSLKIGLFELQALLDTLDKLPKALIPEIRTIRREYESVTDSVDMLLGGFFTYGQYLRNTKEIILYSAEDRAFDDFTAREKQIYLDTLVHELSHGLWRNLSPELQLRWCELSKADAEELTDEMKGAFVYDIEQLREIYLRKEFFETVLELAQTFAELADTFIEEDFCNHFAAYVNHGSEFRALAGNNGDLQEKYRFLKELFTVYGKEEREYADEPLATLAEIDEEKAKLLQQSRTLEEALRYRQRLHIKREADSIRIWESFFPSLEALHETAEERVTWKYIDRQENPEYAYVLQELHQYLPSTADIRIIHPAKFHALLEKDVSRAAAYLTQAFPVLEEEEVREFLLEVLEGLQHMRKEEEKPLAFADEK